MLSENQPASFSGVVEADRRLFEPGERNLAQMLKCDAVQAGKNGSLQAGTAMIAAGLTSETKESSPEPSTRLLHPRVWASLSEGVHQRFRAINAFLDEVLTQATMPEFVHSSPVAAQTLTRISRTLHGLKPLGGSWCWLVSTDLYIDESGGAMVLDHNLACPVGLHRMSELAAQGGATELVDRWVSRQLQPILPGARSKTDRARIAVLDSGSFSPAFRENEYLATRTSGMLVRNRDIVIDSDGLAVINHGQLERIDLLVRRLDDDLLDPNCFRPDSLVGVPGLVRACRNERAAVLNAPGTGIMNHRAISRLIPTMIQHYLGEQPLLNSVKTLVCGIPEERDEVLANLREFAVRTIDPLHPSRPFFGPAASSAEMTAMVARLLKDPSAFVARPLLSASGASSKSTQTVLPESMDDFSQSAGPRSGFNVRTFGGLSDTFRMLPMGIGRKAQPDGGATVAIISDPTTFLVHS